jgi:hypothetical protein
MLIEQEQQHFKDEVTTIFKATRLTKQDVTFHRKKNFWKLAHKNKEL